MSDVSFAWVPTTWTDWVHHPTQIAVSEQVSLHFNAIEDALYFRVSY